MLTSGRKQASLNPAVFSWWGAAQHPMCEDPLRDGINDGTTATRFGGSR